MTLAPEALILSCLKPPADGRGLVVRVLNPTGEEVEAALRPGLGVSEAIPLRLDETPEKGPPLRASSGEIRFRVPAHALRTVLLLPA
jgi:alpha-mannosidase